MSIRPIKYFCFSYSIMRQLFYYCTWVATFGLLIVMVTKEIKCSFVLIEKQNMIRFYWFNILKTGTYVK